MKKIVSCSDNICLYCGELEKKKWDENTPYYECDCPDAVLERNIKDKIADLKRQIPKQKFSIGKEYVLRKIK